MTTALVCACGAPLLLPLPFRPFLSLCRSFSSLSLPLLVVSATSSFLPPSLPPSCLSLCCCCCLLCSALLSICSAAAAEGRDGRGRKREKQGNGRDACGLLQACLGKGSFSVLALSLRAAGGGHRGTKRRKMGRPPTPQRTHHSTGGQETHTKGAASTPLHGGAVGMVVHPFPRKPPLAPSCPLWFGLRSGHRACERKRLTAQSKRRSRLRHNHTSSHQINRTHK
jgi:hypothetical protein